MATRRKTSESSTPRRPPAKTPEDRENQMVALAVDLAERQMREGTASAQVISHYLKLGSPREKIEREKMELEKKLLEARTDSMESAKRVEELYSEAIAAMRSYSGQPEETYDED